MRRVLGPVSAAVVLVVVQGCLVACTSQIGGTAIPAAGAPTSSRAPNTRPSAAPGALTALSPCDMLTGSEQKSLGITGPGEPRKVSQVRLCAWAVDGGTDPLTVTVEFWPDRGIDRITTEQPTEYLDVGKHAAVRYIATGGTACKYALEVDADSRVDVAVVGPDPQQLCEQALGAAKLVAPKVP